jgi:hypothetical protein
MLAALRRRRAAVAARLASARQYDYSPRRRALIGVAVGAMVAAASGCNNDSTGPTTPADFARATTLTTSSTISVNTSKTLSTISPTILGVNFANWYDITQSGLASSVTTMGAKALRWPGGSTSDVYHWRTNWKCQGNYTAPNSTFDNFMTDVAEPASANVAITLNYGSDTTCSHGGSPTEAASWVSYANTTKHYGIKWWTVGNEEWGSWETDLHPIPHDSVTYANAVATGYYPDIKAKDPTSLVGVVVTPGGWPSGWDHYVLGHAKYDFVEMHWYPEAPGQENDSTLMRVMPGQLTTLVNDLKGEMSAAGHTVPIYVGELGSVYSSPGKQSVSITQALFAGEVVGEMLDDGIARATWWIAYGGCGGTGNDASSLYGWQNWGAYNLFADGPAYGCGGLARGTVLPTARAYQVAALFAHANERMLSVSVGSAVSHNVRAYAASQGAGYALLVFNLSEYSAESVPISISSLASGSSMTVTTYDKALYDESKSNVWAGPVTTTSGAWHGPVTVSLPPWSVSTIVLKP